MKILMVCLGNICRSPMAHGLMEEKIKQHQLAWQVDSAGTSAYHQGEAPDVRARGCMKKHHVDICNQQSRPFLKKDFEEFDLIFCMDKMNFRDVLSYTKSEVDKQKVKLILHEIDDELEEEVPDPYYGGEYGFENVYQMLDKATDAIIQHYSK
ncbi:MAG: low molecular weight phosphotyrosine protein phosphatase [Chitinophagales bacterium]|nr:low molecular weight phosphotyrosine protein phosphatase [Chitinophagales bacterium]